MKKMIQIRLLISSLLIVLLVGLSAWRVGSVKAVVPLPECGDATACGVVECTGGLTMCASMPCTWCLGFGPITICSGGIQVCTTPAWPQQ